MNTSVDTRRRPATRARRRTGGATGATEIRAGLPGLGYRLSHHGLEPGGGTPFDPWQRWQDDPGPLGAIGAAILAASPHNAQPWSFVLTGDVVEVHADRTRGTGTVDTRGRELHLALGCAVENLALAAAARGLGPDIELLPDGVGAEAPVARVHLRPSPAQPNPLHEAIARRRSDRSAYDAATPVPRQVLEWLAHTATASHSAVTWVTTPARKAALAALLIDAAEAVSADAEQALDALTWFRFADGRAHRFETADAHPAHGLRDYPTAGLPPGRPQGDAFWVEQTRTVQTATAAAYGIITVADPQDRLTQLRGGRLLQRIHLAATDLGLGLQHMNQITERIDRDHQLDRVGEFDTRMAALLPPGARALATFRVGYPQHHGGSRH